MTRSSDPDQLILPHALFHPIVRAVLDLQKGNCRESWRWWRREPAQLRRLRPPSERKHGVKLWKEGVRLGVETRED